MARARNPRRVLVDQLRPIAKRVRATIEQWDPSDGMKDAARWGREIHLENNPQRWDEVAELGAWLAHEGARLVRLAVEQRARLDEEQ